MSPETINTADLITQIQAIAADHEANAADAAKWRSLVSHCEALGYGPNIAPAQIAGFVPSAHHVAEVVAASAARKSRKGIPLGPRGSRPTGGNGTAGHRPDETREDD